MVTLAFVPVGMRVLIVEPVRHFNCYQRKYTTITHSTIAYYINVICYQFVCKYVHLNAIKKIYTSIKTVQSLNIYMI